jgi:hypothetical protein
MKNESYLTKEVVKIPQFVVGGEYKDEQGNEYRVLSITGDMMEAKFNFVKKRFKIIPYGSVMGAMNSGRVWFKSAKNDPSLIEADESCNIVPRGKYNKLTKMTPEEKRAYRRERARKRRRARRAAKAAINNTEHSTEEHN